MYDNRQCYLNMLNGTKVQKLMTTGLFYFLMLSDRVGT